MKAKDMAEDVLGAAKDGNVKLLIVKVLILPIVIFQRWRTCSSRPSEMSKRRWLASGACV